MKLLPALAAVLFTPFIANAAPPVPGTVMVDEDFSKAEAISKWRLGKGLWTVADGVLKGVEKPEDKHAAGLANQLQYHDADIAFRFQFNGGSSAHLLLRNKFGNLCRLIITRTGITLQRDRPNLPKDTPEKTEVLAKTPAKLEAGRWYQVRASVHGAEFAAAIEGRPPLKGTHAAIDVDKTEVEFMAGGDSILFDDLRVTQPPAK